ncbi:RES domain protein [Legionella quinlivanii]|uniref:RES domain protein n=1 Tax=Legionella quinlivanii TaxID=45073 RepID=A0A0W0Y7Q0_9GAMM|nr:RES family NAD+ phosphorylase [Legionella quinlivanii]KTD52628.1 RES domain protein [Legionella quinlivanii]MCW8451490.1 RES family NAD+ phosphorylase [Legionella quinlivanii]SEG26086.1 RES domain-containing protein [Legionella quinlivanii DSM 21216]STY10308.1 RES domain [Legionella quinlivanii]
MDSVPPRAIKRWIKLHDQIIDYTAEHFSYFAYRRSKIMEELKTSLRDNSINLEFNDWVRVVSQEFSNTPLSTLGSYISFPGGRFNIGNIDPQRFPQFPALYLASESATAFLEMKGLEREEIQEGLTGSELSVAGNFSHFNVRGELTNILDLTKEETLRPFFDLIKDIQLPIYYIKKAREIKSNVMPPVKNLQELLNTLFTANWRLMPMQFDVPANSQILGQIAQAAGLEGVLYHSTKTKKPVLAVYPQNFNYSDSFIEIEGRVAKTVEHTRIDKNTFTNYLP